MQSKFIRVLDFLKIPLVVTLAFASGFTTLHGMCDYVPAWIALILTVAIQSVVVLGTYEIAGLRARAHPIRWASVFVTIAVSLSISIYFSYWTFYQSVHYRTIKSDQRIVITGLLGTYKAQVDSDVKEAIADKREASTRARKAYYDSIGNRPLAARLLRQSWRADRDVDVIERTLKATEKRLADFMAAHTTGSFLATPDTYEVFQAEFRRLDSDIREPLMNVTKTGPAYPAFPTYQTLTTVQKPGGQAEWLPLYLAVAIDFMTVLFSLRLHKQPELELSQEEVELLYAELRDFPMAEVNSEDNLQLSLRKSTIEERSGYHDSQRLLAATILLNHGYLVRVDRDHVEFTDPLYRGVLRLAIPRQGAENSPTDQVSHGDGPTSISIWRRIWIRITRALNRSTVANEAN